MIDLPKPTATLAQLPSKLPALNAQANSLAALLGIKVGESVTARVLDLSPLTRPEREFLIEAAKQLPGRQNPQARAEPARAALAQSAQTQLVRVVVNQTPLALLSDLMLDAGEPITLKIRPDGRLELVAPKPPVTESGQRPNPDTTPRAPTGTTTGREPFKPVAAAQTAPLVTPPSQPAKVTPRTQLAIDKLVHHYGSEPPSPSKPPPLAADRGSARLPPFQQPLFEALHKALADVKTRSAPSETMLRTLQPLPSKLPERLQRELPELAKLVESLTVFKKSVLEGQRLVVQPLATLREAVQRSGLMLEHRLREPGPPAGKSLPETDAKLALLSALTSVAQLKSSGVHELSREGKILLEPLLKLFFGGKPSPEPAAKLPARAQEALQLLHTQLRATLAQIQTQQYRTAASFLGEGQQPAPSLVLELPVRWFDGFGTVTTLWQEFKRPEEPRKRRRDASARKQFWRVYLELDLAEDGMLGADLGVCDKQMDVRMWADREALAQRAQTGLDELRAQLKDQGLTVHDLTCEHTPNPERPVGMHCTYIDERT